MKILLTGSTGYIAKRLLPLLLNNGHEVICCVRDRARFDSEKYRMGQAILVYCFTITCFYFQGNDKKYCQALTRNKFSAGGDLRTTITSFVDNFSIL